MCLRVCEYLEVVIKILQVSFVRSEFITGHVFTSFLRLVREREGERGEIEEGGRDIGRKVREGGRESEGVREKWREGGRKQNTVKIHTIYS